MQLYRADFRAMASPCEVQLWSEQPKLAQHALAAAQHEVARIEAKYSRYRADSVISRINAAAGSAPLPVDDETAGLLDLGQQCFADSDGRFDLTSGVLRRAWDFAQARLPEPGVVDALLPLVGWRKVHWQRPLFGLSKLGMQLDFGGIGKEYAADRAAAVLTELGMSHALVNLGGDVRVLGPQIDGRAWRIGIQHPRNSQALLGYIDLSAGALATSGDYQRFFELKGKRYCHLLNALTGWPVQGAQAATVWAPLCVVAGALASVAMLQGELGLNYLRAAGIQFLWVDAQGRVHQ